MNGGDIVTNSHERELATLRKQRRNSVVKVAVLLFGAFLLYLFLASGSQSTSTGIESLEQAKHELSASGMPRSSEFIDTQDSFREWIEARGYAFEVALMDKISFVILRAAAGVSVSSATGFFGSIYLGTLLGLLRASFIIVACYRLWAFLVIIALAWSSTHSRKAYVAPDMLGQTGNGRVFYSGIRVGLENVSQSGAPEKQVVGLACPGAVPTQTAKSSEFGKILSKYGALNDTNIALSAIILHYDHFPAYIAKSDEEALLANFFDNTTNLPNASAMILERALSLHAAYVSHSAPGVASVSDLGDNEGKINIERYMTMLETHLHRVLTPALQDVLADVTAAELATVVLAFQAGNVMTYAYEGEKWLRRSNFPQLNARAVLHSVPSYGLDYNFETRSMMRRALIYASRSSEFGPVRFPLDLSLKSRALRQWVELLMALPHELHAVADEVELFGIVCEAHAAWNELFLGHAITIQDHAIDEIVASRSNMFFMPLHKVITLLREIIDEGTIRRIEELVSLVSQRQRLRMMSLNFGENADGAQMFPGHERIFPPLSFQELKELSSRHNLSLQDVKDWSALRIVLNSFGWLGRRVGDHTVPESSCVFTVFETDEGFPERNEYGRVGRSGMVPFRGTRLEAKWGKLWATRFPQVHFAYMAETEEDYQKLMSGAKELVIDDEETASTVM